ncbi:maleylpyruvate isomerase family mycothiol-dependent enzyme [Streptomyces sp. NPDC048192]|uniref:maleylpyruvate isomerase family mycothiol-dependent enzyme n=1 Tax=Streptomyces sp. NPDC048192 TaxID=3365510 RepID=UPI00371AB40F
MTTRTRPTLALPRYTSELRREAARLAHAARSVPPAEPVPTCPGWTLADLVRHVRQGHDWATTILTSRSTVFLPPGGLSAAPEDGRSWTERVAELGARGAADDLAGPGRRARFLAEGAHRLAEALDAVGPDVPLWAPYGRQNKEFWLRWALFETAVHRADAALTAGLPFETEPDVALDCVDFCLSAFGEPAARPFLSPLFAEVPRGGETLGFRSARTAPGGPGHWLITCAAEGVRVGREAPAGDPADVTVVAAPADLLLVVKGRLRPRSPRVTVLGDRALLDFWLGHAVS